GRRSTGQVFRKVRNANKPPSTVDDRDRDRRIRLAAAQELEKPLLPAVLLSDEFLHADVIDDLRVSFEPGATLAPAVVRFRDEHARIVPDALHLPGGRVRPDEQTPAVVTHDPNRC